MTKIERINIHINNELGGKQRLTELLRKRLTIVFNSFGISNLIIRGHGNPNENTFEFGDDYIRLNVPLSDNRELYHKLTEAVAHCYARHRKHYKAYFIKQAYPDEDLQHEQVIKMLKRNMQPYQRLRKFVIYLEIVGIMDYVPFNTKLRKNLYLTTFTEDELAYLKLTDLQS